MKKQVKNDILLVGTMLLLALAALLFWRFTRKPGKTLVVRVNGEIAETLSLSENASRSYCDGGNLLVVRDGAAYMEFADCPDKICVRQGRISRTGEVITCLPHRLSVTVEGGEPEVDMVSGGGG